MKKIYFVLLIILSTLIGCSSNTVSNIDLHSSEYSKFDNILKNQQYTKPINSESKPVTIIIYNSKDLSIISEKEYYISNNNSVDISLDNDCSFIISLPINPTVTYSWNTVNVDKNSLFELKNTSTVDLPHDTKDINMPEGVGVSRQNFYFSTVNKGSQSIGFEFKSTVYKSVDNFKITININ